MNTDACPHGFQAGCPDAGCCDTKHGRCSQCNGAGRVEMLEHCPRCKGTGVFVEYIANDLKTAINSCGNASPIQSGHV